MYEGRHIELTHHARRRMNERLVDMSEIREVISTPDEATIDEGHGGRLLSKYLPEWSGI